MAFMGPAVAMAVIDKVEVHSGGEGREKEMIMPEVNTPLHMM